MHLEGCASAWWTDPHIWLNHRRGELGSYTLQLEQPGEQSGSNQGSGLQLKTLHWPLAVRKATVAQSSTRWKWPGGEAARVWCSPSHDNRGWGWANIPTSGYSPQRQRYVEFWAWEEVEEVKGRKRHSRMAVLCKHLKVIVPGTPGLHSSWPTASRRRGGLMLVSVIHCPANETGG